MRRFRGAHRRNVEADRRAQPRQRRRGHASRSETLHPPLMRRARAERPDIEARRVERETQSRIVDLGIMCQHRERRAKASRPTAGSASSGQRRSRRAPGKRSAAA